MSENSQNLSQKLANALEFGNDIEIPSYITQNLNKELREYQVKALQHYFLQRKKPQTNHLMFNMATGSGKTLIMAALMLECYKQGYRNFVFFVNSNAVLEKTKSNFCDEKSAKYLFGKEIIIDNKSVSINAVANLDECKENAINVYFSTIQGLYSLFTNERENAITLQDLKDIKLVFLADEAHHLNANTKKQIEEDEKSGWEGVIKEAFASHKDNLLFEFSATIPNERAVKDKYKDKIVFEYALKEFCENGYSKRINVAKYDNENLQNRILGAVLLSLYRQFIAEKNKLFLKPVILFKSESIKESKENEELFVSLIENLKANDIKSFYNALQAENENHLLKSKAFFEAEFKGDFENLVLLVKNNFNTHKIINVNDDKEAVKHQILLNSLEEKHNEIRVIFAVDKLNEGWDVLNLFDIVRLGKKANSNTTTKEAQLIGRGARYYPFGENDEKFKRKYDNDLTQELSMLERLTYHTINDVEYIKMLNEEMKQKGLFTEFEEENIILTPTQKAKELTNERYVLHFVGNTRNKKVNKNLFEQEDKERLVALIQRLGIPLFSNKVSEYDLLDKEIHKDDELKKFEKDKIAYNVFLKAFNVARLEFSKLKRTFDIQSKREFFELFSNIKLQFDKRQEFSVENQLQIAQFIISNVKNTIIKKTDEYEVSEFKKKELIMDKRVILRQKSSIRNESPQWFYYDKYTLDSDLEKEFVNFIEAHKADIDKAFKKWIMLRNESFNEFKIYDNRKDEATYAFGFEPDFIFFGARREKDKILRVQGMFEVKGEIFAEKDEWKESLLKIISGTYSEGMPDDEIEIKGFPFFAKSKDSGYKREFIDEFEVFVKAD